MSATSPEKKSFVCEYESAVFPNLDLQIPESYIDQVDAMYNLFYEVRGFLGFFNRDKVAWCYVPVHMLMSIVKLQLPIVEVCAGKGFYSRVLQLCQATVHPTSAGPTHNRTESEENPFCVIEDLDWKLAIEKYSAIYGSDYVLFATWTRSHMTDELFERAVKPKYILWQGELRDGCTGVFAISGYKILNVTDCTYPITGWLLHDVCILFEKSETSA
jgi:hypothetical protein